MGGVLLRVNNKIRLIPPNHSFCVKSAHFQGPGLRASVSLPRTCVCARLISAVRTCVFLLGENADRLRTLQQLQNALETLDNLGFEICDTCSHFFPKDELDDDYMCEECVRQALSI